MTGARKRLALLALAAMVLPACAVEQDLAPRLVAPGEARQVAAPDPATSEEPVTSEEPDIGEQPPTDEPNEAPSEVETEPAVEAAGELDTVVPAPPPVRAPSPANVPPVAQDVQAATLEDTPVTIDVLADVFDVDADAVELVRVSTPSRGTAVVVGGQVVYTPELDVNGQDSFTYSVADPSGDASTATVTVDIAAVNDAPVALDDAARTREDQAVTVDVLGNDVDVDGDVLAIAGVGAAALGTPRIVAGELVYLPDPDISGTDRFTYTVRDPSGATDQATVTVLITPINDTPIAADDALTVDQNAAATVVDVLANDSDVDGDPLVVSSVTQPDLGVVTLVDGIVAFQPLSGASGTTTFNYRVSDGRRSDLGRVTVTIRPAVGPPPNQAPAANDDGPYWVAVDGVVLLGDLLANDADPNGDALTIQLVDPPTVGTFQLIGGTDVEYTHDSGAGPLPDSFTYRVSDGSVWSAPATVTLVKNDPPDALADFLQTNADPGDSITYNVVTGVGPAGFAGGVDSDPDGHALTYTGPMDMAELGAVFNGSLAGVEDFTCDATGECTLTITAGAECNTEFDYEYAIVDEYGLQDTAVMAVLLFIVCP